MSRYAELRPIITPSKTNVRWPIKECRMRYLLEPSEWRVHNYLIYTRNGVERRQSPVTLHRPDRFPKPTGTGGSPAECVCKPLIHPLSISYPLTFSSLSIRRPIKNHTDFTYCAFTSNNVELKFTLFLKNIYEPNNQYSANNIAG